MPEATFRAALRAEACRATASRRSHAHTPPSCGGAGECAQVRVGVKEHGRVGIEEHGTVGESSAYALEGLEVESHQAQGPAHKCAEEKGMR